jgi:CHAT domain-containing protein
MSEPVQAVRRRRWPGAALLILLLPWAALAEPGGGVAQWTEGERAAAAAGDSVGRVGALLHRAEAYQSLGLLAPAAADVAAALALARASGDRAAIATAQGMLGAVLLAGGDLNGAVPALQDSITAAEALRLDRVLAASLLNRGLVEIAGGHPDQALPWLSRSADAAMRAGDALAVAAAEIDLARAQLAGGRPAAAAVPLDSAAERLAAAAAGSRKAFLLAALAATRERLVAGQPPAAIAAAAPGIAAALDEAGRLAAAEGDRRLQAAVAGHRGRLQELLGEDAAALQSTRVAVQLAQSLDEPASLFPWEWQAGRLLARLGKTDAAIAAYRRAIGDLQRFRYDAVLAPDAFGEGFRKAIGPVYGELADLLLRRAEAERGTPAFEATLREVRDVMEGLKSGELEDYFRDDCVTSLRSRTRGIEGLAPDTAALYPVLLPDRMALLLSLGGRLDLVTVPVGAATVEAEVRAFRYQLERVATRQFLRPARQLYDWLIRPVADRLAGARVTTIVFVPDGALRTVPIAALEDGRHFLAESYATVVEPGLTLLDPRPIAREQVRALLAALTESRQGFPALPAAGPEVDRIGQLYDSTTLRDQDYVVSRLQDALAERPYTVVHLASHGEFGDRAERSFILTYDDRLTLDRLESFIKLSRFRDRPVELLVLSACQTASGNDRAALGLAGIAIKAGARSAVASLWSISDEASERLITAFYAALRDPRVSKAEALRHAELTLIADRRFRHPGYWSAFLLIGNWL